MERIHNMLLAVVVVVMIQCTGASVCAAASQANTTAEVIAPVSPHAPTAFWSGLVTLTVIGAARTLRRQLALLR